MYRTNSSTHPPRIVQVGIALFVVGLGFVLADVLPFFFGAHDRPLWLNIACLAAPTGFVLAMLGAWQVGRADARVAAAAASGVDTAAMDEPTGR